jgi:hypothetical protein
MFWAIGNFDENNKWVENREAVVDGKLLADGEHKAIFQYFDVVEDAVLIVKDGKFTKCEGGAGLSVQQQSISDAVEKAGYWGEFIEGFFVVKDGTNAGKIQIKVGS